MADQNEMDKITTSMMGHLCDCKCRIPKELWSQEEIDCICAECQMGRYVCDILNTYNAACKLQAGAETVRSELMQKGDWYNALVSSIYGYLREADGSIPYDQMAEGLADRIVGVEPEN